MQIPQGASTLEAQASARRWTYRGVIAALLFGGLTVVALQWRSGVTITSVEVRDECQTSWFTETPGCVAIRAESEKIAAAVAIEPGGLLYEVNPADIVARVSQHPWVADAHVSRTPGGKLIVEITPRQAELLVMQRGRPAFYVDAEGHAMPFVEGVAYDVPLVFGSVGGTENGLARDARLSRLAVALTSIEPDVDALISEIELSASDAAIIRTTPVEHGPWAHPSLETLVDLNALEDQLLVLRAYWDQVLLTSASTGIRQIDLRFNSRVITR